MRRLILSLLLLAAPAAAQTPPAIPGAETMAAHRGAYRLTLERARDNSDVAQVEGAMVFEVADACEGWATRQRFTMTITDRAGDVVETTSEYSTFEYKNARRLRFSMVQTAQGAVTQRLGGEALMNADGSGTVRYTDPAAREEPLAAGTMLPMQHTIEALRVARSGGRILVVSIFDGTDEEGAQDTTTIMAGWQPAQPHPRFEALSPLASARMRIAFFGRDAQAGGAAAPDYEVGLRYYENGIADELQMDFGDFVLAGRLDKLEVLPGGC
jgi:hypothetical protein